ncbi:MAG: hypothetical protein Ct9H90mP3_7590 [Flammeovirgaceae bacterium]|nr:MAG: hypothetical protein Ct9H90mP3_7590 [Flammeovirgaceae bacterium]
MNKVSTPDEIYKINELQLRILVMEEARFEIFK